MARYYIFRSQPGLIEIIHDVFHVLNSHGIRTSHPYSDFSPSLFASGRVGHGCGMRRIRVSTPPEIPPASIRVFPEHFLALESDPVSKVIIEPKPVIVVAPVRAVDVQEVLGKRLFPPSYGGQNSATILPLRSCCSMRTAESLLPAGRASTRKERDRSRSFLHEGQLVSLFFRSADYNATQAVACPFRNFVVEWTTMFRSTNPLYVANATCAASARYARRRKQNWW